MSEFNFVNFYTIKDYIKEKEKFKSADEAVKLFTERFEQEMKEVISYAKNLSLQDRRKTIMKRDIIAAIDEKLGQLKLPWREAFNQLVKQNPSELGKIAQQIDSYLRKEK